MKKIGIIIILLLVATITLSAQNVKYSRVIIYANNSEAIELAKSGINFDNVSGKKGTYYIMELSDKEISILSEKNTYFQVLIDDMSKFYSERSQQNKSSRSPQSYSRNYTTPEHFNFGSMGGFLTLSEVYAELDEMATLFPDLITSKVPASSTVKTIENRDVYFVKIGKDLPTKTVKPEVLYTSLIHAREPESMQQLIWYMWYMLENYNNNDEIKYIVDNIDMYFIPVVNPDSYFYNETTNPNGGGMWRKNKRDNNANGSFSTDDDGVDLNRNFGFMWGYDDNGSSPDPSSATYRGTSAFSEPETQILKEFTENHNFLLAHNHHTYSNLMILPWGYEETHSPDDNLLRTYANFMASENGYTVGQGWEILYTVNGDSNDWMYGEHGILAFTQETGNSTDGFWPEQDRIIPLCEESYKSNLYLARFATKYAEINDASPYFVDNSGYLKINLKRLGYGGEGNYEMNITSENNVFSNTIPTINFTSLEVLESKIDSFQYTLNENINYGDEFSYTITISNENYSISKTFTKQYKQTTEIISDNGDNLDNWISTSWATTTESYHSENSSITDSEGGMYENGADSYITSNQSISLHDITNARLYFWAKWDIENNWDYAQILISTDDGSTWTALEGNYTNPGEGSFQPNEPVYDGGSSWVQEEINLDAYLNENVLFRFLLKSDDYTTGDGFYFDDFSIISLIENPNKVEDLKSEIRISPNPTKEKFTIKSEKLIKTVKIYDIFGKLVKTYKNQEKYSILGLSSGMYLIRIETNEDVKTTKLIIE